MAANELFNWYETKAMKEIVEKEEPYPFENTQIRVSSRILCVGSTNSCKTQSLLHYIRLSPGTFSKIIVFHKESEPLYQLLERALGDAIEFHTSLSDLPTLRDMRKDYTKGQRILLVFDDFMMELASQRFKNVNDYFIYGRKKNITIFCISQNYFSIPKVLRNQMTYLLLFSMVQQRDIKMMLSDYDTEDKQLLGIYKDAIKEQGSFLKIQTGRVEDENKRFSKGFTNFYKIAD